SRCFSALLRSKRNDVRGSMCRRANSSSDGLCWCPLKSALNASRESEAKAMLCPMYLAVDMANIECQSRIKVKGLSCSNFHLGLHIVCCKLHDVVHKVRLGEAAWLVRMGIRESLW